MKNDHDYLGSESGDDQLELDVDDDDKENPDDHRGNKVSDLEADDINITNINGDDVTITSWPQSYR